MNTKGNSLEEISERITDAILSEPFINKKELIPRIRVILRTWIKISDLVNLDNLKLTKMIVARETEAQFWREKMRENFTKEQMQKFYNECDSYLTGQGLKL